MRESKILILTSDDFYQTLDGEKMRGGFRRLYDVEYAVRKMKDGSYNIIKNRDNLPEYEIVKIVSEVENWTDNRILLSI